MILKGYGINLIRLTEEYIELVRLQRNADHVRNAMDFRQEITKEMQLKWFQSIDNIHNNYMLIERDQKMIGLINGAGIDWDKKTTGSGGIFIWDKTYWATSVPSAAALLLTDTSVFFGLEKTFAKVMNDNQKAKTFNRRLGYTLLEEHERFCTYELLMSNYEIKRKKLRKAFPASVYEPIEIEVKTPSHPVVQFLIPKIEAAVTKYPGQLILS